MTHNTIAERVEHGKQRNHRHGSHNGERHDCRLFRIPIGNARNQRKHNQHHICGDLDGKHLAERGFLTIAFDPSYYGESGGTPRYLTSPEISTEDFSAAVDYLTSRADVDPERIGILGICGWGGFALNAAANDPRIKATVTSTMYDMSRVNANGYFDAMSSDDRYKLREQLNAQRTEDYRDDSYVRDGGVLDPVTDDTPQFVKEYHDYYKTERGYHRRSPNSNEGITKTSVLSFINMPLLTYISEIRSAVLLSLIHI